MRFTQTKPYLRLDLKGNVQKQYLSEGTVATEVVVSRPEQDGWHRWCTRETASGLASHYLSVYQERTIRCLPDYCTSDSTLVDLALRAGEHEQ